MNSLHVIKDEIRIKNISKYILCDESHKSRADVIMKRDNV